jgi:hypothetical protein
VAASWVGDGARSRRGWKARGDIERERERELSRRSERVGEIEVDLDGVR